VDSIVSWADAAQCARVTLSVRAANHLAIALYRRHGFVAAGPNRRDANAGEPPEQKMALVISS
jgi:ribosomal protein S18 acetylase RimI-like enzyme